jgi:apolipoprotein D and lipocalin family protein
MRTIKILLILAGIVSGFSFSNHKKSIDVVSNFDVNKYLGKWYEIARLDYKWERNLNNVTAFYTLNKNGTIKVDNKGFNYIEKEWEQSTGKAKLAGNKKEGKLKVSFFGPFYSAYNVVAIDPDYNYALVIGSSTKYMWLLSRNKTMPEQVKKEYVSKAKSLGVETEDLIWVEHD